MMVPQPLGNGTERGYYIFFDIKQWLRERVGIPLLDNMFKLTIHAA
jgi:hypothetical protein